MEMSPFLMTPGPTEIPLRVLQAMMRPGVTPGDPAFVETWDETASLLQTILETKNEVILFPGSGRVAIEAGITSILDPGDRVLTINNGVFGKWLGLTVEKAGGELVELISDPRRSIDPAQVRDKLAAEQDVKAVAVVHNETSTGVVNPVAEIGRIVKDYGALYVVDTVSSVAGDVVRTDQWQIDVNCTGCYKCMNCPAGIAIVAVSEDGWTAMSERQERRSFSFDLYKWLEMWIPPERGGKLIWGHRRHVVEPAPHVTYALNEALRMILEEGLAERVRRNRRAGRALRAAVEAMDLELYPRDESFASNTLTAILNPPGIENSAIIQMMKDEFAVIIGGGLEETSGKVLRIAHMGTTASEMHMTYTVSALARTLTKLGRATDEGSGLDAAMRIFGSVE